MAAWCSQRVAGHGTLYFRPMGRQAIPAQSLADYYRQRFQIKITMLPAVDVRKFLVRCPSAINAVPSDDPPGQAYYPQIARALIR